MTSVPSTATVTATPAPGLTIAKSATPTVISAIGDQVSYTFLVSNTGNVTLSNLAVADTFTAPAGPALTVSCPVTTLTAAGTAGSSTTCTALYTATAADLDHGSITNSATASGAPPTGPTVTSAPSSATVQATSAPSISVVKSASPQTLSAIGGVVHYSFLVTNTGNVTLTGVAVTDNLAAPAGPALTVVCPLTTLAAAGQPGSSTTCTADYVTTAADFNVGSIHNRATAGGLPARRPGRCLRCQPATVTLTQSPLMTIVKSASPTTVSAIGAVVHYSFLVTNTGNVTLGGLNITDTLTAPAAPAPVITCPVNSLAAAGRPGASTTCTADYVTTAADFDAGSVNNSAFATATPPSGATVNTNTSTATVTASQTPSLSIEKTASPTTVTAIGDQVQYSFLVSNTGNVTVSGLVVADAFAGPAGPPLTVSCPATTLTAQGTGAGSQTVCTALYTTTAGDFDAGVIKNTATVSGKSPTGASVISPESSATVTAEQHARLSVLKSAAPTTVKNIGDHVTYSFAVTNTGNVTLHDVVIDDAFDSPAGPALAITCPVTTLAAAGQPGDSTVCSADYVTTAADFNVGIVNNTATASALPPTGTSRVTSEKSTATVTAVQAGGLTVVKDTVPRDVVATAAGQQINYTFLVTNTGNVTVTVLLVADQLLAHRDSVQPVVTCPSTVLAAGAQLLCTASYLVQQSDLDLGSLDNTATASGLDPTGNTVVSGPSEKVVPVVQTSGLTMTKSASPTAITQAGQQVVYTFDVQNTGNVTISHLAIDDTFSAPAAPALETTCALTSLAPNAITTCTGTYTATQADVDHGRIDNTATATGTDPAGGTVASGRSSAAVTIAATPDLTVTKTADLTKITKAGQVIHYTLTATNTGNVTLRSVVVKDELAPPAGPAVILTCSPDLATTPLAPGDVATCTGSYTVTQADVDHGGVTNSAVGIAAPPTGPPVEPPPTVIVLPATNSPALTIVKSASPTTVHHAGDTVTYSFELTNTGNVRLTGLTVADQFASPAGPALQVSCPATVLDPLQSVVCTATYRASQADVDAEQIRNTATATGIDPIGSPVHAGQSSATVLIPPAQGLTLVKSAQVRDVNGDGVIGVGDQVLYSFLVTNTGNITVDNPTVSDPTAGAVTCPAGAALAPGASVTCTATTPHTVTQTDVDAGHVSNTATASATPSCPTASSVPVALRGNGSSVVGCSNPVTSPPSTVVTPIARQGGLTITKTAAAVDVNHDGIISVGDRVEWTLTVRNSGSTTIDDLTVSDPTAGPVTCPATTLAAGTSEICTVAAHVVTAQDVTAGVVSNSATANGVGPGGPVVSNTATASVTVSPLAYTGAPIRLMLNLAGLLLLLGVGLYLLGYRRRYRA